MHLRDAHQRVMSVAAVQQQLLAASPGDRVYVGPYLSRLSETLAASMTDDSRPISLEVQADGGTVSSAEALSIGLIVTELVINAFKHAFIGDAAPGALVIAHEAVETSLRLTVSDNGIGTQEGQLDSDKPRPGLGTIIVAALAKQLDARVELMSSGRGTTVSITYGTSDRAGLPLAGAGTGLAPKSSGDSVAVA
jgi:two-component sensor histidine kinase